mmetsp:Transcript_25700/g.80461  ORF Transcript_25700/g.80461 Transcript_25700/m.80461 type:complete len:451 (-) Transcript_25700:2940-4292(-)
MAAPPPSKRARPAGASTVRANDHISLWQRGQPTPAAPTYTHQIWDDEELEVADGAAPPEIAVAFSAASLRFEVEVCGASPAQEAAIRERLARVLPGDSSSAQEQEERAKQAQQQQQSSPVERGDEDGEVFAPKGALLCEYDVMPRGALRDVSAGCGPARHFEVYRVAGGAEQQEAEAFHDRAQSLAYWFIETADAVSLADDRWEVFYVFEALSEGRRRFAAYQTVFHFRNPVRGVVARVCQALVLPWYQRQGHGRRLLQLAWERAQSDAGTCLLTVENPCAAFQGMRDAVDAANVIASLKGQDRLRDTAKWLGGERSWLWKSACEKDPKATTEVVAVHAVSLINFAPTSLEELSKSLKITKAQLQVCLDAIAFYLQESYPGVDERPLRLALKRRFHRLRADELAAMVSKQDRISFLQAEYVLARQRYRRMCKAIKRSVEALHPKGRADCL